MLTPSLKIVMRNGKIFAFLMNMTCTFVSCFGLSFHKKTVGENRAHSLLQKEKREFAKSDLSKEIFPGIRKMVNPIFMSLNVFLYFLGISFWLFFIIKFVFLSFSFLFLMKYQIFATEYLPVRNMNSDPPEQGEQGRLLPSQSFLTMCPFFRRAL